jgi:hypothetical protein
MNDGESVLHVHVEGGPLRSDRAVSERKIVPHVGHGRALTNVGSRDQCKRRIPQALGIRGIERIMCDTHPIGWTFHDDHRFVAVLEIASADSV